MNIYFARYIYWIESGRVLDYSPCGLVYDTCSTGIQDSILQGVRNRRREHSLSNQCSLLEIYI